MIVRTTTYERSTLVNDEKYIGLDVHQATIVVAVMDSTGKLVMESILETEAATILQFFAKVASGVTTGLLIKKVSPIYPDDARAAYIPGTVVLRAEISKAGDITDLELVDGPIELAGSAVAARAPVEVQAIPANGTTCHCRYADTGQLFAPALNLHLLSPAAVAAFRNVTSLCPCSPLGAC